MTLQNGWPHGGANWQPIRNVVGQYLLEARRATRRDRTSVLAALERSRRVITSPIIATMWSGGQNMTFGGTAERPGKGFEFHGSVERHAGLLRTFSEFPTLKGQGYARTLGRSRYGGSTNRELLGRTGLFIDCDDCGTAMQLLAVLNALGIAYIYQARQSGTRWHIELFFAEEVQAPASVDSEETLAQWVRSWFRPAMAWLLGIFSELGELDCKLDLHNGHVSISKLGADGASANRLLGLGNGYARRTSDEPIPETDFRDGARLHVETLLEATGFAPPEEPTRGRDAKAPTALRAVDDDDDDNDAPAGDDDVTEGDEDAVLDHNGGAWATREPLRSAVVAAYSAAGLLHHDLGRHAIVRCPFGDGHSTGADGDTSTVILPNGLVKCLHGSCGDRRPGDFLTSLPNDAGMAFLARLPDILAAEEEDLYLPSTLALAAWLSAADPLRFAEHLRGLPEAVAERWMPFVRKERRR